MAQQDKKGKKGKKAKAGEAAAMSGAAQESADESAALRDTIRELEARSELLAKERDRLAAELAQAHARISTLETRNAEAANRIGRVIESLEALAGREA